MNTNKIFELFAKYIWPYMRLFVGLSKRCKRCILSEKYTPLVNGLCRECLHFTSNSEKKNIEASKETRVRFDNVIRSYVSKNKYDALLLLSGGKDSTYILHRLKSEYPDLKILSLIVNNGFMSPVAIKNAQIVSEKNKVDLLNCNSFIDEFSSVIREAFLSLNGRGGSGVVDHADGSLIFKIGKQIANDFQIPLVIGGLSWVQVQQIIGKDDFELKEDPKSPNIVFPLAVWRTNEQEIRKTVRELKLMQPGSDSPIVSNSTLILAMSVIDIMNLGYSSFEPEFAQLIRENKTDRKLWLHLFELLEFATRRGLLNRDMNEVLKKLNLTITDVIKESK